MILNIKQNLYIVLVIAIDAYKKNSINLPTMEKMV